MVKSITLAIRIRIGIQEDSIIFNGIKSTNYSWDLRLIQIRTQLLMVCFVILGKILVNTLPGSVALLEIPHKHFTEMPSITVGNYRTVYFSSYVRYRTRTWQPVLWIRTHFFSDSDPQFFFRIRIRIRILRLIFWPQIFLNGTSKLLSYGNLYVREKIFQ
jgi:hypothetical protein